MKTNLQGKRWSQMNQLQYITGIHCITIKEEMIQRSQGMKKQPYFRGIPNHTDMMIKGN